MVSPGASDGWVDMAGTYWDPGEMLQKTLPKKKNIAKMVRKKLKG
jgi:hypothetical protein